MSLKKPFSVCFLLLLGNSLVFAQAWETTSTQKSNERARSIIYSSLEAHGGKERLEAVSNVSLNFKGTHNLPLQNIQPDFSRNPLPKEGKFIFDIKGRRMVFEEKIQRAGVYTGWHRLASDGKQDF